jgi:hypothetical protein
MRRHYFLIICALCLAQFSKAQAESEVLASDSVDYLTPEEYAIMLHEDKRLLFKVFPIYGGLEWEFIENFSIEALGGLNNQNDLFASAEFRHYFTKSSRRSSLNGAYIATGGSLTNGSFSATDYGFPSNENRGRLYLKLGLQRRFIGSGLADISLQFSSMQIFTDNQELNLNSDQTIFGNLSITTPVRIGLGLGSKKSGNLDYEKLCPVLKCHSQERFLIKLDLANAFQFYISDLTLESSFALKASIEQKLGNAPFSLQANLGAFTLFSTYFRNIESYQLKQSSILFATGIEFRYYYNLNARIRKGKTGNSLSANYFGLEYQYSNSRIQWEVPRIDGRNTNGRSTNSNRKIHISTGVQRTFGERLYFDVSFGASIQPDFSDISFEPFIRTAIGLRIG